MDSNDQDKILNTDSEKVLENTSTFTNSSGSEVKKTKVQPKSYYPCHLCHRKFQALRGLHYHQHYMHGLETPKKKVIIKRNLNVRQKAYSGIPSLMKQLQETENANKESVSDLKPPEPKRQKTDDNDNNLEQRSSRSCNICLFNSSAEDCKNHMTSHQFLFPYDCKKCHWRFDSKLKLIEHTQYCQDNHGDSVKIFISKIGNNPRNSYTVSLDTPDHLKEPLTRDVNSLSEKSNVSFEQISKLYAAQHNDLKLLKGPRVVLKRLQKEDISKWQFGPSPQTFCAMLSQNCDGLLMKIRKTNLEQSAQKEGALTKTVYSSDNCKDSLDGTSKNSAECGNEGDQSMIPQESEENENPNKKTNNFLCNLLNKGNTSSDVPISVCKVGDTAPSTVEKPVSTVTVNPIVVKSVTVPLPSSTSLAVAKPTLPNPASKVSGEVAANNSRVNIIDGSNSGKTVNSGDNIDEQVAVIVERIMSTSGMQCSTNTVGIKSISANENTTQKHTELTSLSPNVKSPSNSEASNSFLPTLANLLKNSPKAANPQPLNKQSNVHSLKRSTVVKAQNNSGTQRMTVSQIINGVGNYKCPTCERYFKSKYSLETHLLIHQDLRPFPCPICSKPFRQKCTLTRHMLVHRENMIECDKCKKIFQNPAEFQSHLSHCAEGARGRILKPNTLTSSSVIQPTNPNMLRANMQNLQNRNFVNNSVAARAAVQRSGTIIHPNPNRQMQNRKMLNNEVIEIEDDDEIIEVNKQKLLQQQMVSARRNSAGTTSISANSAYPVIQNVCSAGISLPSSSGTPPGTSKTMTISVTSAPLEKLPLKSNNPSNPYISQIMQNKQITLTPVQKPEQSNSSGIITNSQLPHPLPVPTPLLKNKELTIVPLTTSSINTKNDSVTIIPVATTNSPDHRTMSSVHAQSSSKVAGVSITPVAQKASPNQFLHSRLTQNSTYSQSQQHHNSASYSVAPPPPPLIPIQGTPSSMRVQHIPVSGSNSINQISYSSYNQRSNAGNEYSNRQGGAFSNQTGQYQRSYSGNAAAAAAAATAATTAATTYQQQLQQRLYQQRISQQQQLAQQRQLAQQQLAQRQQMNQQRQLAQQQQQLVQQMAQQNRHNAAVYPNAGPNPNTNQSIRYPSVSRYPQYRSLPQQASSATSQQRGSYGYPYATQAYSGPAPNVQLQQRLQGYVPSHTGQRMPQATPYGKYPPHPPVPPYSAVSSPQVLNKNNPLSTLSQFVETNTSPSQPSTPSWHHPSTSEANAYFNQKSTSSISQNTSYYSTNPQASTASTWFPQSGIPPATQPNIINVAACEIPDNQTATANLNASTNKENQTRFSSQASNPVQDIEAMSCGICSQVFSDDAMLSAHLLTHTDQNGDLDVILCSEVPKVDFFNVKQEKVEEASKSSDNTTNENQEEEILNTPKFRNLSNVLLLSDEEDVETNTPEPEASPANFNSGSAVQINKDQVMVVEVVEPEVVPVIPHQTLAATVIEDFQSPTTVIEENQTTEETVVIEENNIDETATMGSPVPEVEDEPCHDSIDELENGDMLGKEIEQPTMVDVYMTSKEIQDVKKDLNERSTEDNNIVASIIASICKSVETGLPYATETDFQIKRFNDISKVKDDNEFYYDTMEACEKSSRAQSEIDIDENIAEDMASDHEDGTDSQSPNMNIERHLVEEHTELETNLMDCDETADDVNSKHFSDNFASSPSSINALDLSIEKSCSCSSLNISGETPGTCCPDEDMSINEDPISLQLSDNEDETQYEDNSEMNVVTQEQSFNIESLHSAYQDSIIEEEEDEEEDGMKVGESVLGYYSDRVSEEMQNWSSSNGEAFTVQFSCPICDQVFGTQQLFYKHLVMHQEPLNSSCNYCSKTFASPQQLKKHLKQHLWQNHLKNSVSYRKRVHDHYKFLPPRMAFKCKICSKKFFNFKLYRIHHRQCGKSWTAAKTLAIPIIDLQTVARNTNNLESLGITGFIPLMSQAHSNSESSSLMQKLGIPLVDTKNLQAEHLRNLAELEINQSLLLDGLQTVDNILEDHSNVINQDLSNIRDSEMESFSEVQKSDSCAQSEYSEETSNLDSIDVSKVDGVSNGKADSISSPELDKGLIQELEMGEISETDVLIPKAETASELSNLKDELTISVVSSESDTIITKDSVEDMVPKVNHLSPSQQIDNGKDQVNGFTKNQEETGPSQETLDNLKKLGLMIEVRSLASEICVSTVDKTDK